MRAAVPVPPSTTEIISVFMVAATCGDIAVRHGLGSIVFTVLSLASVMRSAT